MSSRKNIHRESFLVSGELPPSLHDSLVGSRVLGPRKGDEAEVEGREGRVDVVIAQKEEGGEGTDGEKVNHMNDAEDDRRVKEGKGGREGWRG